MNFELKDKVVLVTGGAKGIGAAICRAAAQEGALPVIVDRDEDAGRSLLAELGAERARFVAANLCGADRCREAVQQAEAFFGRLDSVVNNAGINDGVGLERGTPQQFRESLERNLLHYYDVAHFAFPALQRARGTIVNIASKVAFTGQGNTSGYAAAKGGVVALTREWAAELLPFGIRVNAVIPAEVMTPLYEQWLGQFAEPQQKLELIISRIPLGRRMTTIEEIAATVMFLISAQSSHTTGQLVFVDGGYVHLDRALT
ncbi:MAG TPA: SDR family oxidoreductase [Candidatus Acidoferrales bacterium]|nr:SDR family oxidoreductase [Candidatus Acidoferrales bacterium]